MTELISGSRPSPAFPSSRSHRWQRRGATTPPPILLTTRTGVRTQRKAGWDQEVPAMTMACGTLGTTRCRRQTRTNHGRTGTQWVNPDSLRETRGLTGVEGLLSQRTTQCGDQEDRANGRVQTSGHVVVEENQTTGDPHHRGNQEARAIGEPETAGPCSEDPRGMGTALRYPGEPMTSQVTWAQISGVQAKMETEAQLHQVVSEIIVSPPLT